MPARNLVWILIVATIALLLWNGPDVIARRETVYELFSPLVDMEKTATRGSSYTALIEVRGVIADKESASADNIVTSLRTAFEDPKVKGVILRINSPGGSPVQSGYVYDEIRRLRAHREH